MLKFTKYEYAEVLRDNAGKPFSEREIPAAAIADRRYPNITVICLVYAEIVRPIFTSFEI